jgi:hypothetical protein
MTSSLRRDSHPMFLQTKCESDPIASARLVAFKKRGGGAERCLFGSSRVLKSCDFRPQCRDALVDFLHGKIVEALPNPKSRHLLSWRRAKNLIVISSHSKPPPLAMKTIIRAFYHPLWGSLL